MHSVDPRPSVVVKAGQDSQLIAPSEEICPIKQSWHSVAVDSPSGWKVPAGQGEHSFPSTNVPAGQVTGTHSVDPGPAVVCPGGQESQLLAPGKDLVPIGQGWHSVAVDSSSGWKNPGKQDSH